MEIGDLVYHKSANRNECRNPKTFVIVAKGTVDYGNGNPIPIVVLHDNSWRFLSEVSKEMPPLDMSRTHAKIKMAKDFDMSIELP